MTGQKPESPLTTYRVIATTPLSGVGSSMASRVVGPFECRRLAEEAAAKLVDDPRCYATIRIARLDEDEED